MGHEGVYTPTAHEGALRRGDGLESLLGGGGGSHLGGTKGPTSGCGRWRDGTGPGRRSAAAIPHIGRS